MDEDVKKSMREWYIGLATFVVFVALVGAVGWGYSRIKFTNSNLQFTNNKTEVPKVSPQPTATQSGGQAVFAVWNASGKVGAAGKLADKIKAEGYEVREIKNAPKEQTGTTIEISPDLESQADKIVEMVELGTEPARMILAGSEKYNVRIVIGK